MSENTNGSTELNEELPAAEETSVSGGSVQGASSEGSETPENSPSVAENAPDIEADTASGNDHEDDNDQDSQTDVEMGSDNASSTENKEDFSAPEEEIPEGETRASYNLKKIIAAEGERKAAYQQNKEELLSKMKEIIEEGHHEEQAD